MNDRKLRSLLSSIKSVNRAGVEGDVYEFGIALGGSAILMARRMGERSFHGFDVFEQIPAPGEKDAKDSHERYAQITAGESEGINGDLYYGYEKNLFQKVKDSFEHHGLAVDGKSIQLHRGLFEDTLNLPAEAKIALVHIDCDWYEPVLFCLQTTAPHIEMGGLIIVDDYNDYEGCRKATDVFLSENPKFKLQTTKGHAVIRRVN